MPVVQHSYLKLRIIRKFYFFLSPPIAKSRIVDPIFHLHTICTKIPLPYAAEGLARVKKRKKESTAAGKALRPARRGGLGKSKKRIWRAKQGSRKDGKPVRRGGKSYRADHYSFASLRLCESKK